MAATGGAAVALGIWYQSIGAVAALVNKWTFEKQATQKGGVSGTSEVVPTNELRKLRLEPFDMDAAINDSLGVEFIQFKVSAQHPLPDFGLDEVYEIFQNATRATIGHEDQCGEKIRRFIVATNRPGERTLRLLHSAVAQAVTSIEDEVDSPEFIAAFSRAAAPLNLFRQPKNSEGSRRSTRGRKIKASADKHTVKSMLDLVDRILWKKANEWGVPHDKCARACLKVITRFAFKRAQPGEFESALYNWFYDYGVLRGEEEAYVDNVLGQLIRSSLEGTPRDASSIMGRALNSSCAVPITPRAISCVAMEDIRNRVCGDPPTPCLIDKEGFVDWTLDRSAILRGLPHKYGDDPPGRSSQIFALVGDGAVGKSIMFAQLFYRIGRGLENWNTSEKLGEGRFIGYPIILEPEKNWEAGISGKIRTWGRRNFASDQEVERFATSGRVAGPDPAVWVGFDGIDEMTGRRLKQLAREIVGYAARNPNVRFVLTSRKDQFEMMTSIPNVENAIRRLSVGEFSEDEGWDAISRATNGEVQPRTESDYFSTAGEPTGIEDVVSVPESGYFKSSIQQPLFVGVMQSVYEAEGADVIRAAHGGDQEAWKIIATKYVHVFCERLYRRLDNPYAKQVRIFRTLKQLSIEVADNPQGANMRQWQKVSKAQLEGHMKGYKLYEHCVASGLITRGQAGSFEWRNPYVAKFLPDMEEDPEWQ